jgi:hypothetical protein
MSKDAPIHPKYMDLMAVQTQCSEGLMLISSQALFPNEKVGKAYTNTSASHSKPAKAHNQSSKETGRNNLCD